MKGKIKEFFDGDMDQDDTPENMEGDFDHDDDMVECDATEIKLVASEPTKVTGVDGTTVLVSAGDTVNIVSEEKTRKINKEKK